MAYDRSKNLKDFNEFFTIHLIKERDISKFNVTSKIPEMILKSIKHEYGTKDTGSKGLFSNDRIMAYLLVFDYDNMNSLDDAIELYFNIASDEAIKVADEKFKTVKVFICNKYPWIIDEVDEDIPYMDVVKSYMENDNTTEDIIKKIQERVHPYNAKQMTFFTSCKYNLGVKNLFNCVFNEIKHKEALWQKITFEPKKEVIEDEENEDQKEDEASTGFFCCKRSKKMENKLEESAIKNQSFQDKMRFKDEEDIDYDKNQSIAPREIKKNSDQDENENEKETKKSMCSLF
jgi:hypothetical protein